MDKKLFIHGWATDGAVWEGIVSAFGGNEAHILTPNLPGHGSATRWLEPSLNPALAGLSGISSSTKGRIKGFGWSIGAQILLSLAARTPEKFSSLVLIGATPCFTAKADFPYAQPRALVRRMIMDMKRDTDAALKRFYPLNFTVDELAERGAKAFMQRYAPPGPIICDKGAGTDAAPTSCRQAFNYGDIITALEALYNTDIRSLLGRIKTPVLIIHGAEDNVVPVGAGQFLADNIEKATLEVFPAVGHAPFITAKEKFVEVVKAFWFTLEDN